MNSNTIRQAELAYKWVIIFINLEERRDQNNNDRIGSIDFFLQVEGGRISNIK